VEGWKRGGQNALPEPRGRKKSREKGGREEECARVKPANRDEKEKGGTIGKTRTHALLVSKKKRVRLGDAQSGVQKNTEGKVEERGKGLAVFR